MIMDVSSGRLIGAQIDGFAEENTIDPMEYGHAVAPMPPFIVLVPGRAD
jgi:hypothetical protein